MNINDITPQRLNELSPATLASYKKKAGAAATAADAAGDTKTGNQRFSGIVKATKKQFDQDAKGKKTNEAAPPGYDTATGKPLPPEARFDPNTGKPLPGVSSAPAAAAPTQPWLPTSNKSKEAAYAAANKAKAAPPTVAAPVAAPVAPTVAAPTAPAAAPVAAPAAATPPRDTSKSIYDGDTGELTAYGAELKAKEKVDRQAAYAAAEANKAKAAPAAAPAAAPVAAPAALTTTGMVQPRTTSPATNPAGKKVDIVQAAKAAMAAGGNPEAAAIAAMKAKNPKLAAMMAQAGLDDQGNDIATAPAAPVAEHYVLDELDHGKLIESQLDNTLDDLYKTLNEFSPGGAEGAGPYAYGIALKEMAELYAEGEFDLVDVSGMDTTSQNQSDAEEINSVADAFMNRGMEAGREAYSMVDTMVQEDMDEYLDGQGFNVDADIHAEYQKDVDRYNDSPAGQADKDQQAQQDAEWEEDLPTWRAAQVEIAAVNPKNQSSVLHSVQFDARKYNSSVGELKSTLEQQLSKIKQGKSDAVIRITLGGKPTDMQGILDQFKQIDNKTTRDSDVTEGALASMKRLAGIAPAQTTPGQRQYRHMPTAVQPR
jgi:hypothetical protein